MEKTFDPAYLTQFTGSENFYRHALVPHITYTDGALYVAESAGAFWLLDEITIAQYKSKVRALEFQVWKLVVVGTHGTLTVEDGDGLVIWTKDIPYTFFPAPEVVLWVENGTIYLPSER